MTQTRMTLGCFIALAALMVGLMGWQRAETDTRLADMNARLDARFDGVDARFDGVDARFDGVDARFADMNARFDGIESRLGHLEAGQVELRERMARLEGTLSAALAFASADRFVETERHTVE